MTKRKWNGIFLIPWKKADLNECYSKQWEKHKSLHCINFKYSWDFIPQLDDTKQIKNRSRESTVYETLVVNTDWKRKVGDDSMRKNAFSASVRNSTHIPSTQRKAGHGFASIGVGVRWGAKNCPSCPRHRSWTSELWLSQGNTAVLLQ